MMKVDDAMLKALEESARNFAEVTGHHGRSHMGLGEGVSIPFFCCVSVILLQ